MPDRQPDPQQETRMASGAQDTSLAPRADQETKGEVGDPAGQLPTEATRDPNLESQALAAVSALGGREDFTPLANAISRTLKEDTDTARLLIEEVLARPKDIVAFKPDMLDPTDKTIHGFALSAIGQGGFGLVALYYNLVTKRIEALKLLVPKSQTEASQPDTSPQTKDPSVVASTPTQDEPFQLQDDGSANQSPQGEPPNLVSVASTPTQPGDALGKEIKPDPAQAENHSLSFELEGDLPSIIASLSLEAGFVPDREIESFSDEIRFMNKIRTTAQRDKRQQSLLENLFAGFGSSGTINGTPWYTMTYQADGSLAQYADNSLPRLSNEAAYEFLLQYGLDLLYLKQLGVLHCDIKPANLTLDRHGIGRFLDMGMASVNSMAAKEQATGGTPAFMAPEQIFGGNLTEDTDLYSLVVTIYYLMTGKFPYGKISEREKLKCIQRRIAPELEIDDPVLKAIMEKALQVNPAERGGSEAAGNSSVQELLEAVFPHTRAARKFETLQEYKEQPYPEQCVPMPAATADAGPYQPAYKHPADFIHGINAIAATTKNKPTKKAFEERKAAVEAAIQQRELATAQQEAEQTAAELEQTAAKLEETEQVAGQTASQLAEAVQTKAAQSEQLALAEEVVRQHETKLGKLSTTSKIMRALVIATTLAGAVIGREYYKSNSQTSETAWKANRLPLPNQPEIEKEKGTISIERTDDGGEEIVLFTSADPFKIPLSECVQYWSDGVLTGIRVNRLTDEQLRTLLKIPAEEPISKDYDRMRIITILGNNLREPVAEDNPKLATFWFRETANTLATTEGMFTRADNPHFLGARGNKDCEYVGDYDGSYMDPALVNFFQNYPDADHCTVPGEDQAAAAAKLRFVNGVKRAFNNRAAKDAAAAEAAEEAPGGLTPEQLKQMREGLLPNTKEVERAKQRMRQLNPLDSQRSEIHKALEEQIAWELHSNTALQFALERASTKRG